MFALRRSNVLCGIASSAQRRYISKTFLLNARDEKINESVQVQKIPNLQKSRFLAFSSYMRSELERNGSEYMRNYLDTIRELTDYSKFTLMPNNFEQAEEHFIKMMDYTLSDGHRDYILLTIKMYKDLMGDRELTAEETRQTHLLGWSLELLMASYLINDDIIDDSKIRRGKTCWHRIEGMEKIAVNDMLMLENGCYLIINRFFGHLPCYAGMIKTITEAFMVSFMGHSLEIQTAKTGIDRFTIEGFNYTSIMKGCLYRFYIPAACTMLLAGYDLKKDQKIFEAIKLITHEIGPYYVAQNDFFDCFVDQNRLGKPGDDIEKGKFSWCVTMAMELGSEQQKDVLRKHYGRNDIDSVAKVKRVYDDLHLPEIFNDYKKRNQNNVMNLIDELLQSDETLKNACRNYFNQAYD